MARHDNGPPIWHGAVEQAPFDFYEPDTVGDRWAGGFSANGSHIGVAGTIDGFTVVVDTSGRERTLSKPLERRASISDLLWHHLMSGDTDITLPYSPSIEADNRTATIGSDSYRVHGMHVAGDDRWVGGVTIGDVHVKITTTSPQRQIPIRKCTDAASLTRPRPRRD